MKNITSKIAIVSASDNGHDEAVKYADKQRKRIRKVLGYTYP